MPRASSIHLNHVADPADARQLQARLAWMLQLRWVAIGMQAGVLLTAWITLGRTFSAVPWAAMCALLAGAALCNLGLVWFQRHNPLRGLLPLMLVLDVLSLTAMLVVAGGPANPFCVFYLMPVALAALLLERRHAWGLTLLTMLCCGLMFGLPRAHAQLGTQFISEHAALYRTGMGTAYGLVALFMLYSVRRVTWLVQRHDDELGAMRHVATQNERLAMLSSFAANAAHELGSPLSTISIAAQELAGQVAHVPDLQPLREDVALINQEVARCRAILGDLSARAGTSMGELPVRMALGELEGLLRAQLAPRLSRRLMVEYLTPAACQTHVLLPPQTLIQVLRNLVRNATDAHREAGLDRPVVVRIDAGPPLRICVADQGPGLPTEVRERVGQPFVTTHAAQGGLGLGLYLAQAFAERLGGSMSVRDRQPQGTEVELCLPRNG